MEEIKLPAFCKDCQYTPIRQRHGYVHIVCQAEPKPRIVVAVAPPDENCYLRKAGAEDEREQGT